MPPTIGGVTIDPQGQTLTVTVTPSAKVYTDAAGTSLASFPATVTTRTSYWMSSAQQFTVSVKTPQGVEIADGAGSPLVLDIQQGTMEGIAPVVDRPGPEDQAQSSTYASLANRSVNVHDPLYNVQPDVSVDQSAGVAAALAAAGPYGTVEFSKSGEYIFSATVGALTHLNGAGPRIVGSSRKGVFFKAPSAAAAVLTVLGYGDNTDDGLTLENLCFRTTVDRAYDAPMVVLTNVKNYRFRNVGFDCDGHTGTGILFDSSYQGSWRDSDLLTGKAFVPFEVAGVTNLGGTSSPPQMDTMKFDTVVVTGCIGGIIRNAVNEVHGVMFDNFKVVGTNYYSGSSNIEATLSASCAAGATAITVTDATGIVPGDAIVIDYESTNAVGGAAKVDVNRVSSVVGSTLNLVQPLRYAHDPTARGASIPVLVAGIGMAVGDGVHTLIGLNVHFEGPQVGWGLGGVQSFESIAGYSGVGRYIYLYGGPQDIRVGTTHIRGTQYHNDVLVRPTYNTVSSDTGRWRMEGPFVLDTSAPLQTSPALGDAHTSRNWKVHNTNNGYLHELWSSPAVSAVARYRTVQANGVAKAIDYYAGRSLRADGIQSAYLSSAGRLLAVDGDFTVAPTDGLIVVTRDSTLDKVRVGARGNGRWAAFEEVGASARTFTRAGIWYGPVCVANTGIPAEGTLFLSKIEISRPCTLNGIACEVTTVGTSGAVVRLGIYNDDGTGYPGTLLLDAGTIDGTVLSSTTPSIIVISQAVVPGTYWVGGVVQGGAGTRPTVRQVNSGVVGVGQSTTTAGAGLAAGYTQTGVTGALANFTASPSSVGSGLRAMVKAA